VPIACATISSAPPSPYISAVSIKVNPAAMPARNAATSRRAASARSPIVHVPRPSAGIAEPSVKVTAGMIGSFVVMNIPVRRTP